MNWEIFKKSTTNFVTPPPSRKKRPVNSLISRSGEPLSFLAPSPWPPLIGLFRFLTPFYVQKKLGISKVRLENEAGLEKALQDFYAGRSRLVLAYRHPSIDDPPLIYKVVTHDLPKRMKKAGRRLPVNPHLHFMYDRGLTLWAGKIYEWWLPRFGATPILRGSADRPGLAAARRLVAEGRHPLAVAPEGGTNRKSYRAGKPEAGLVQLAAWAQEDLLKAGQPVLPVVILPLGLSYSYEERHWKKLDSLLDELETAFFSPEALFNTGATGQDDDLYGGIPDNDLRQRLTRLMGLHTAMLSELEAYYRKYFNYALPLPGTQADRRVENLLDFLLALCEKNLNLSPSQGRPIERCHRIEVAAWDRMFHSEPAIPIVAGLADLTAREAQSVLQHERLAEALCHLQLDYLRDKPGFDRLVEIIYIMWDVMSACLNYTYGSRPRVSPVQVKVKVGQPILLAAPGEEIARPARKEAIRAVYTALQHELYRLTTGS